ncbi:uncharacterized protein LOC122244760 [Penaeus japonicus]|uniref:uncharacterized protein LOC122244760 n=1 Tax=Penaeus japonicus TaxID=27405 RepID=UPI001C712311|nr:uncharacterized protein LOC122244760 [Penaeus japonicus]
MGFYTIFMSIVTVFSDKLWCQCSAVQRFALRLAHCSPLAAHPGVFRTYTKAKQLFSFPNMLSRTKQFVQEYQECQIRKGCTTKNEPLASAPEVSHPLERVSADLIQLPRSTRRNLYVLVIVDHLSRFVELISLPDKKAHTIAEAFIDSYFTIYGILLELQTDGGGEFNNKLMSAVFKELLIQFRITVPYNPQANGVVERTNRVIKSALSAICAHHIRTWDDYLPQVRFALNTSIHRTVIDQPLYLFTGHHVDIPVGLSKRPIDDDDSPRSMLRENLEEAWKAAQEASQVAPPNMDKRL